MLSPLPPLLHPRSVGLHGARTPCRFVFWGGMTAALAAVVATRRPSAHRSGAGHGCEVAMLPRVLRLACVAENLCSALLLCAFTGPWGEHGVSFHCIVTSPERLFDGCFALALHWAQRPGQDQARELCPAALSVCPCLPPHLCKCLVTVGGRLARGDALSLVQTSTACGRSTFCRGN